jgi:hypothetical protein
LNRPSFLLVWSYEGKELAMDYVGAFEMNAQRIYSCRALRLSIVIGCILFADVMPPLAQSVTIGFGSMGEGPGQLLPWQEGGFTVASLTSSNAPFIRLGGGFLDGGRALRFNGGINLSSAIITNDSMLTFDLLSLDIVSLNTLGSGTNYMRIVSSAGGSYDLFDTPNGTTLSFTNSEWENLSYLKVEFLSSSPSFVGLELDRIVVQSVPEPSIILLCALFLFGIVTFKPRHDHSDTALGGIRNRNTIRLSTPADGVESRI